MMRVLYAALFLVAGAGAASAAAYDDFSRGVNANNKGDANLVITSFTAALAAGDLAPAYVPQAYFGRARAYLQIHKCTEALGDLAETAKARPNDAEVHLYNGLADYCLGKLDEGQKEFETAIGMRPSAAFYQSFALGQWGLGLSQQAAENFRQAATLTAKSDRHAIYLVLWYAISAARAGTLDHAALDGFESKFDFDDWPRPIVDFYRGKSTVETLYREAASSDTQIAANQKCEADFYVGEWQLAGSDKPAGKGLLQQAVNECPRNFFEYYMAKHDLEKLP